MGELTQISEHMPHFIFNCGETVHVVPVSVIRDFVSGKIPLSEVDYHENIMRKMAAEWLEHVTQ